MLIYLLVGNIIKIRLREQFCKCTGISTEVGSRRHIRKEADKNNAGLKTDFDRTYNGIRKGNKSKIKKGGKK